MNEHPNKVHILRLVSFKPLYFVVGVSPVKFPTVSLVGSILRIDYMFLVSCIACK